MLIATIEYLTETFSVSFSTPPLRWWDDYGARDWLSVWLWRQGSVLGSDWPPRVAGIVVAEPELRARGACVRVRLRWRARLFRAYNFPPSFIAFLEGV